eukprot:1225009-Pyramimonas_sp.AAC.1
MRVDFQTRCFDQNRPMEQYPLQRTWTRRCNSSCAPPFTADCTSSAILSNCTCPGSLIAPPNTTALHSLALGPAKEGDAQLFAAW